MNFTVLVALVIALVIKETLAERKQCGVRQQKTRSLITHGYEVQLGDYPWHTAIYQLLPVKIYICGGTLVGQSVVITAAHCVMVPGQSVAKSIDELSVYVGKHLLDTRSDFEQEYGLSSIILHQDFRVEAHDNDIALLITKEPVVYGKFVQPACLPIFSLLTNSTVGTVVGWGFAEDRKVSNVLRAADAPYVSRRTCMASNPVAFLKTVTDNMFCAGYRNGTNACNGDSGGGIFKNIGGRWYLMGIVSFTAARNENENVCSTTDFTAFTNVHKYRNWIEDKSNTSFDVPCYTRPGKLKKRYFVHNHREVEFLEAWRLCQSSGHRLATITSEEDNRLIEEAVSKSSNPKGPWFIGGTDLGNEGHFIWISTNTPVGYNTGYLNYSPGQPDNAGNNENCLEIGRWGGVVWNDVPCNWKQRFICEHVVRE